MVARRKKTTKATPKAAPTPVIEGVDPTTQKIVDALAPLFECASQFGQDQFTAGRITQWESKGYQDVLMGSSQEVIKRLTAMLK